MRARSLAGGLAALALLLPAAAPADAGYRFGERALARGSHGHDVRVLQSWLTRLGFPATVDGAFGPGTRRSVRAYERRFGLRVDGRVSRGEARGLRQRVAPRARPGRARLAANGRTAIAPAGAPAAVRGAIAAANRITRAPYRYGGGHGRFRDTGYDCSGAVSYVLHGAGVLATPLASPALMSFGRAGHGRWITVYAHGGHAFVVVAGLRFDTSGVGEDGPRWRAEARSGRGYAIRHPTGL